MHVAINKPTARHGLIASALLCLTLLTGCGPTPSTTHTSSPAAALSAPQGQLPATVAPRSYRLELSILPEQAEFSGHTEIDITLTKAAQSIWLHGDELRVSQAQALLPDGRTIEAEYRQVDAIGVAQLSFTEQLPAGDATLVFDYSAPYNESLEGLYRVIDKGEAYAFTQFEATSARLAFPSFDEPRFKVPFDITLEVDADHRAVTNTPALQETVLDDGRKRITYATTKPLPTYLIAFAVGELDEVVWEPVAATELRATPLPLRGYATKGKGERLRYALENTADIVTTLESYFGTAYPYRKLDIIAVPDFQAGAMENAGAITYREQLILLDDQAPVTQKRRYAEVHAHELAHQWFGNLVTPQWWNDIWLNESFATWMAYRAMETLAQDGSYAQAKLAEAMNAMGHDRLVSARQIRQPIAAHADIASAFDGITYEKGGAVLSMFERFIGADAFKAGIQNYMREFAWGNTDARDFIRAIAAQRPDLAEGTVEAAFFSFLEQPGTPRVALDWTCEQGAVSVEVQQSRYLPVGSSGDTNKQWQLPLCIAYDQNGERQEHCQLVNQAAASFALSGTSCPTYIMPNAGASGYYRFSLTAEKWAALFEQAPLTDAEMLAAANSLSAAFHAGDLDMDAYLAALPHLLASNNNEVIRAPMGDLSFMLEELSNEQTREPLRQRLHSLYQKKLAGLGLDASLTTDNAVQLRRSLVHFLTAELESAELRNTLAARAQVYTGTDAAASLQPTALDSNLRYAALYSAVQTLDSGYRSHLKALMLDSRDALLRQELLFALGGDSDPAMLAELRALILSPQLRDNEIHYLIRPQMANPSTRDTMWQWLLDNREAVLARLPAWAKGKFVNAAGTFCSAGRHDQIRDTLGDEIRALEGGPRALANTLERINLCAALVRKQTQH
mgnify:CR=1 FL=1